MPGKLQPEVLRDKVLNFTGALRDDLLVGGGLGEDAALISVPSGILVAASDPVTGAVKGAGSLLVHINANDLACKGADPSWLIVTLIVPDDYPPLPPLDKRGTAGSPAMLREGFREGSAADFIAEIMKEIHATCSEMNIAIAGGHTELTDKYSSPVISGTMLGMTHYTLSTKNIHEGDMLLVTGHAGLEGMSIIAHDKPELFTGIFSGEELRTIRSWQNDLSVLKPARILRKYAHYMHDPTEGGLSGALCETSQACGLGLELFTDKIPVHELTLRASQKLGFSPLNLISSGMLIAVIPEERVGDAQHRLAEAGISSSIAGRFISGKSSVKLDAHEELWGILVL
ncbi:MAG: hydrogenase expression protein [Synergistaceae bacterium]|nr:hydrogenase expression protein [Synergistaceae bacterium]